MSRKHPKLREFRQAIAPAASAQRASAPPPAGALGCAPAGLNLEAEKALLMHRLERAHAEIARLRSLAYVDPAADPDTCEPDELPTWKDKAQALALQLAQLSPNACRQLEVTLLEDHHDCETCGSSFAQGALVRLNGEVVVDRTPCAHCFGSNSFPLDRVLYETLERLGFTVTVESAEAEERDPWPSGDEDDGG